jgi:group I intron endonuclease
MHYTPNVDLAFISVEHIMRDVNSGWFLRYTHANVASFFFLFLYFHTARGLYYSSYKTPRVLLWSIGVIILILTMAIAFLGYLHGPKWFNVTSHVAGYHLLEPKAYYSYVFKANPSLVCEYWQASPSFGSCFVFLCAQHPLWPGNQGTGGVMAKRGYRMYPKEASACPTDPTLRALIQRNVRTEAEGLSSPTKVGLLCSDNREPYSFNDLYSEDNVDAAGTGDRLKTIIKELDLIPEYVFENLNLEETKQEILKNTKGLSGIYMIINKVTKDYYIGSASTNRFYARFTNHLIYFKGSKIVKLAVKKYKLENFAFIILELYPNVVTKENNKELIDLEDKYLKLLVPNYNILTEAGSSFGYKHTEVDRQKMKDLFSDARREMIGRLNRGKKLSKETIEKMRAKALNRPPMSKETRQKCIGNTRPVILYNLNGTIYGQYSTTLEAAKALNCSDQTIRRSLKTAKKLVKRQ